MQESSDRLLKFVLGASDKNNPTEDENNSNKPPTEEDCSFNYKLAQLNKMLNNSEFNPTLPGNSGTIVQGVVFDHINFLENTTLDQEQPNINEEDLEKPKHGYNLRERKPVEYWPDSLKGTDIL